MIPTATRLADALLGADHADRDDLAAVLATDADLLALADADLDAAVAHVTRAVVAQLHATARAAAAADARAA